MLEKVITLLFIGGDAVSFTKLASLLLVKKEEIEQNIPVIRNAVESIGLTLLESNDGIAIVTKKEQSDLVAAFLKEEREGDLTPATLQVLTLIAYLGYPTREQISYIRGVQSSQSIRALTVRGLVHKVGEVCSLTEDALKELGITKVEELPEYVTITKVFLEKLEKREL